MNTTILESRSAESQAVSRREFRLIPQLDTYPWAVSFVQTAVGKLCLIALFGLGLRFFYPNSDDVVGLALLFCLITFLPEYRRTILALAPILMLAQRVIDERLVVVESLAVVAFGMMLYACVMRWPRSAFAKRPIVVLLTGFSALIAAACYASQNARAHLVLWSLVGVFAGYVWFIAYAVTDKSSKPKPDATLELATFRPLWGTTNTPFPKGAAYLRRIEAKTPQQLAVVQLKGLKLLAWAILLSLLQNVWFKFFHGYLHIPLPDQAVAMNVRGTPLPWHLCWASQILAYFEMILKYSILGHKFIAGCRIAGFNALRNTYRPLSSRSVIDFFNRFYYYFKELLVEFFYYPAFFRYWKRHRRMRTIFATFAAVLVGDSFYHLTRDWQFFRDRGLWGGIASYQVLAFHNFVLAVGLSVSQLRKRGPKLAGFFRGRLMPATGVALFYILALVFACGDRTFTLPQTLKYFAGLFFIHW